MPLRVETVTWRPGSASATFRTRTGFPDVGQFVRAFGLERVGLELHLGRRDLQDRALVAVGRVALAADEQRVGVRGTRRAAFVELETPGTTQAAKGEGVLEGNGEIAGVGPLQHTRTVALGRGRRDFSSERVAVPRAGVVQLELPVGPPELPRLEHDLRDLLELEARRAAGVRREGGFAGRGDGEFPALPDDAFVVDEADLGGGGEGKRQGGVKRRRFSWDPCEGWRKVRYCTYTTARVVREERDRFDLRWSDLARCAAALTAPATESVSRSSPFPPPMLPTRCGAST